MFAYDYEDCPKDNLENNTVLSDLHTSLCKLFSVWCVNDSAKQQKAVDKIVRCIILGDISSPLAEVFDGVLFEDFESFLRGYRTTTNWEIFRKMRKEYPLHIVKKEYLRMFFGENNNANCIFFLSENGNEEFIYIF